MKARDTDKEFARKIGGLRRLRSLIPHLDSLRDSGCGRDRAGNRRLRFDDYTLLMLLAMLNPVLDSMRAVQRASGLAKVKKLLGVSRASLGSLSEAPSVFDPGLLENVVREMIGSAVPVADPKSSDPRLKDFHHALTAVDGTFLRTLPKLAATWAWTRGDGKPHHVFRLHADFDIVLGVPIRVRLTPGVNGSPETMPEPLRRMDSDAAGPPADGGERAMLRARLMPGRCYIMDRGFIDFGLYSEIKKAGSCYVARLSDHVRLEDAAIVEERLLSEDALAAGVVRDAIIGLGRNVKGRAPLRCRVVSYEVTTTRAGRGKPARKELITVATDVDTLEPELIAVLYRYRWQVELFFRCFKQLLHCRHLYSAHPSGVMIQSYAAIIACLLVQSLTGRRPDKATVEMISHFMTGWASLEELVAHLKRRPGSASKGV